MLSRLRNDWHKLSTRTKALITAGLTVVVLAGVILGLSAISNPKDDGLEKPDQATLSSADRSRIAYEQAVAALSSGETTKAIALLEQAVQLDPSNTVARRRLAEAEQPSSSTTTSPKPTSGKKPTKSDPFLKSVSDLKVLLPKKAEGYSLGYVDAGKTDVTINGSPTSAASPLSRSLWSVHDKGDAKNAKAFIEKTSKRAFRQDAGSVTVDGAQAYFGTDGTQFATMVYVRGRYVFEVIVTVVGGDPAAQKGLATEAAKAFPDSL